MGFDVTGFPAGLLMYAPLRTSLDMRQGTGPLVIAGGGNGTVIDCDGVVHTVSADKPRCFGARRVSDGVYDYHDDTGAKIPIRVADVYPNGGCGIGDSNMDNTYSLTKWLARKLSITVDNFGVGGNTLQTILADQVPQVISGGYDWCVVQGGTNNLYAAVADPNTAMQAATTSIAEALVAASITPIFLGVSPWGGDVECTPDRQTWTNTYNTWLEAYCTTNGYHFVDLYDLLADPAATDDLHATYDSGDGLHWSTNALNVESADRAIGEVIYYHLKSNTLRAALVEPAVENLAIYSEDASNAAWAESNVSVTQPADAAPDGAANVDLITATAANGTMLQTVTAGAGDYCFSCWLKRDTGTGWIELTPDGGTTWKRAHVVDSWQRFDVTASTTNPVFGVRIQADTDAVLFWGGQLEVGKAPWSYVPTVAAAVTKPAETLKFASASNTNRQAGTLVLELEKQKTYLERNATTERVIVDGGSTNFLFQTASGSGTHSWFRYGADDNHLLSCGTLSLIDRKTTFKVCLMWDSTGITAETIYDGPAAGTTYSDAPDETNYNALGEYVFLGSAIAGTVQYGLHFRGAWVFDSVLTSEQLAALEVSYEAAGASAIKTRLGLSATPGRPYAAWVAKDEVVSALGHEFTLPVNRMHYAMPINRIHWTLPVNRMHYAIPEED